MSNDEAMTEEEAKELIRRHSSDGTTLFGFMKNVVMTDDTTRVGNLTQDELGMPKIPVRTMKELSLFSKDIADDSGWSAYFDSLSKIQTDTSLSKEGFLLKTAITSKRELADVTPRSERKNRGWFKGKNKGEEETK